MGADDHEPVVGFDPQAPGTPEGHWLGFLDRAAEEVCAGRLLPPHSRLVVLAAHPDDESLGAGGLLAHAARLGRPATVVVATSGEESHPLSTTHTPDQLARTREREVAEAVTLVHPQAELVLLRLPDGDLAARETDLVDAVEALLDEHCVLVAPFRHDGHTDHEAAGRAAAVVADRIGIGVLEYPIWVWHWGTSADLADVDLVLVPLGAAERAARHLAQQAHVSQVEPLSGLPGDEVLLPPAVVQRFGRPFELFVLRRPRRPAPSPTGSVRSRDHEFDAMFVDSDDPWGFETSWYEQRKRAVTLAALPRHDLGRVLEVGCSTGVLTAELADRATAVTGTDVSGEAVERARRRLVARPHVTIHQLRSPQQWAEGVFDLVVLSEIGYFWDPSELDLALTRVVGCLAPGGLVLLCHWRHPVQGWPLDGDRVHEAARDHPRLTSVLTHAEADFVVDVLSTGPFASPAVLEGLA